MQLGLTTCGSPRLEQAKWGASVAQAKSPVPASRSSQPAARRGRKWRRRLLGHALGGGRGRCGPPTTPTTVRSCGSCSPIRGTDRPSWVGDATRTTGAHSRRGSQRDSAIDRDGSGGHCQAATPMPGRFSGNADGERRVPVTCSTHPVLSRWSVGAATPSRSLRRSGRLRVRSGECGPSSTGDRGAAKSS